MAIGSFLDSIIGKDWVKKLHTMAILVVEFSREGYKIRKVLA
jgi:hypothetical protein